MAEIELPVIERSEPPVVVTVGANQGFLNRLLGGFIGSCVVGVISTMFRYSVFTWLPVILGGVLALFGWKVHPPEKVRDFGHDVIERVEKGMDRTADKLKGVREAMEEAKAKAALEVERVKVKTAEEKEILAKKISDIEIKSKQEKAELARQLAEMKEKAEEAKRSLAGKVVKTVVENRVEAAKSGLASLLPSWGKTEEAAPARDPNKTMVRLAGGQFNVPNGKCKYCSALLVVGEIKGHTPDGKPATYTYAPDNPFGVVSYNDGVTVDNVNCPRCGERVAPVWARIEYDLQRINQLDRRSQSTSPRRRY